MKVWITHGPYTRKLDGRRYVFVEYDDGETKYTALSRFRMERKLGRKLSKHEEVDHIDEDPTNDKLSNLQILTGYANKSKAHATGKSTHKYITKWAKSAKGRRLNSARIRGEKAPWAKLNDSDVTRMRKVFARGKVSVSQLMLRYGVSRSSITNALKGRTFSHLPGRLTAEFIMKMRSVHTAR